jgi:hypothetical protein
VRQRLRAADLPMPMLPVLPSHSVSSRGVRCAYRQRLSFLRTC